MVYNNEFTTTNSVLVALNMQRSEDGPLNCASFSDLESFIKISAFLFEECADKGMKISLAANGSDENGVFVRESDLHSLLYSLAEIEDSCTLRFVEMFDYISLSGFTDIVIITPYISGALVDFAERQRCENRNVVFCCAESADIPFETVKIGKTHSFVKPCEETEAV